MKGMNSWAIGGIATALVVVLGILVMYLWNPYHTASRDPRARVFGSVVYVNTSDNMYPTLERGGPFIVDAKAFMSHGPQPRELVAYFAPPDGKDLLIGRVIALGGSTVEMRNGTVFVDGVEVHEPYVAAPADGETGTVLALRKLERDTCFVLGDNRAHSKDSRDFGAVNSDRLIGRVLTMNFGTRKQ